MPEFRVNTIEEINDVRSLPYLLISSCMTLMRYPRHHTGIQGLTRDLPRWDDAPPHMAQAPAAPSRPHAPREHGGLRPSLLGRSSEATSRGARGRNRAHSPPRHPNHRAARRVGQRRARPGAGLAEELVPHRREASQGRRLDRLVRCFDSYPRHSIPSLM